MPTPKKHADKQARQAAYRERKRREASLEASPSVVEASPEENDASSVTEALSEALLDPVEARLMHEMENAQLPADRIRAAGELRRHYMEKLSRDQSQTDPHIARLIALKDVCDTLPPEERVAFLDSKITFV